MPIVDEQKKEGLQRCSNCHFVGVMEPYSVPSVAIHMNDGKESYAVHFPGEKEPRMFKEKPSRLDILRELEKLEKDSKLFSAEEVAKKDSLIEELQGEVNKLKAELEKAKKAKK